MQWLEVDLNEPWEFDEKLIEIFQEGFLVLIPMQDKYATAEYVDVSS